MRRQEIDGGLSEMEAKSKREHEWMRVRVLWAIANF